ncbi:inverse autotransporter beta domain-containing protein [Xenorhabdus sp. PB61.4]|uniref:inverse autotransporter beta domain-containing protein n=1 Tax=Xenorhabdus sp. PB61.4 TaxID=2788940 RepID=UPI001E450384|nr:inverse autotransporter beta domain-containing protein [Xenorhabdus sp. PB61.4]MCC8367246.1 inverse autotransporter beta domain-containing protein [Xenorhabdus sp. PB61.4]
MPSYIGKVIGFFTIIYTLLIPSTIMNAFAEGYVTNEKTITPKIDNVDTQVTESSKKFLTPEADKKGGTGNTSHTSEYEHADAIGRNIQMAGNILSSSPSELAEQAKSYALGKVNSTISSEAQKWLSQSSTARVNFGFDRKGRLENNSIDLLLPIYDNQAAWFFFSQLGYRNKDSRNTVNLGLGGRYFSQNWMYGLNTFYDYDITGKNRRVGLGGELWGDYIKFSTNGYYRLSDWQISRNFEEHHERPANGYDINGEFFLSAYPNLGGKFSYEQYFGDNVTLFNRKTKQKNPSLAKMGVTYTPIPLITMGMDYKQGERGQSETQFLTNFNLRFGVPLSAQLSPDNVASMRTLAGSRYDLVERNNNIVLDHRKVPVAKFSIPKTIVGYSDGVFDIPVKFLTDAPVKDFYWTITGNREEAFKNGGGKLSYKSGNIQLTFPNYLTEGNQDTNNSYTVFVAFELTDKEKTKAEQIQVIVKPFEIQKKGDGSNFTPRGPLNATGKIKDGYTFDPVITFDTQNNLKTVQNDTIHNVEWVAVPEQDPLENGKKLKFHPQDKFEKITIDGNGHFPKESRVILTSDGYVGKVDVYLSMDGQDKQLVGKVTFKSNNLKYKISDITVFPKPSNKVFADGKSTYTYSATIENGDNTKIKEGTKIDNVKWIAKDATDKDITDKLIVVKKSVLVDKNSNLEWEIASDQPFKDIAVSLSIENQPPTLAKQKATFLKPEIRLEIPSGPFIVNESYIVKAIIDDENLKGSIKWDVSSEAISKTSDIKNEIMLSTDKKEEIRVVASINNNGEIISSPPVTLNFEWPVINKITTVNVDHYPGDKYTFKTAVTDSTGKVSYTGHGNTFNWYIKTPTSWEEQGLTLSPLESKDVLVDNEGNLKAVLSSSPNKSAVIGIIVCARIKNKNVIISETEVCSNSVGFIEDKSKYNVDHIEITPDPKKSLIADGEQAYTYEALILNHEKNPVKNAIVGANWSVDNSSKEVKLHISKDGLQTDNEGKLKVTLTSTKKVENIIVSLSIENQPPKKAQGVSFTWPFISKPTATPKSGDVVNNGKDSYKYTAQVYESDHSTPYTGDKIKFQWTLQKPKNDDTTYLKDKEEMIVSSEGKLENHLVSSHTPPVEDAIVCVSIANNPTPENGQQCANQVSFSNEYTLNLTVNNPSPMLEGENNKYIFTAEIKSKSKKDNISNIPITWSTSLPVPLEQEPKLVIEKENMTDSKGLATFTMYSTDGGFKNITITASADTINLNSKPITVEIIAKPKESRNIILLTYPVTDTSGIATTINGITATDLNFGWKELRFFPREPSNSEINGSTGHYYSSNNMNIIEANEQYFQVKKAGSTKVKSYYTFPSGRYIVYETKMNINMMVFSDANPRWFQDNTQINPALQCETGTPVEVSDIGVNITNLVKQGADFKKAGLIAPLVFNIGYSGLNISDYTQLYPIAPGDQSSTMYSLLCHN